MLIVTITMIKAIKKALQVPTEKTLKDYYGYEELPDTDDFLVSKSSIDNKENINDTIKYFKEVKGVKETLDEIEKFNGTIPTNLQGFEEFIIKYGLNLRDIKVFDATIIGYLKRILKMTNPKITLFESAGGRMFVRLIDYYMPVCMEARAIIAKYQWSIIKKYNKN